MYIYLGMIWCVYIYIITHTYTHLRIWCTGLFGNREPQIRWSIIICPVKRALHSGWFPNFHSHILFRDISLLKSHPYPTKKIALHHKIAAPAKPHVLPPEGPDQNELPKPCRKAMFSFHKKNIGYPCIFVASTKSWNWTCKLDWHVWVQKRGDSTTIHWGIVWMQPLARLYTTAGGLYTAQYPTTAG